MTTPDIMTTMKEKDDSDSDSDSGDYDEFIASLSEPTIQIDTTKNSNSNRSWFWNRKSNGN